MQIVPVILPFIIFWVLGAMISLHLSKDTINESEKLGHIVNGILFGYITCIGVLTFYISEKISVFILYLKNRRNKNNA